MPILSLNRHQSLYDRLDCHKSIFQRDLNPDHNDWIAWNEFRFQCPGLSFCLTASSTATSRAAKASTARTPWHQGHSRKRWVLGSKPLNFFSVGTRSANLHLNYLGCWTICTKWFYLAIFMSSFTSNEQIWYILQFSMPWSWFKLMGSNIKTFLALRLIVF